MCVCRDEQQRDDSRDSFDIYFTNLNEPGTAAAGLQGCLMSWFNQTVNICLLHSYSVSSLASFMKVLKKYKGEQEREREKDVEERWPKGIVRPC